MSYLLQVEMDENKQFLIEFLAQFAEKLPCDSEVEDCCWESWEMINSLHKNANKK